VSPEWPHSRWSAWLFYSYFHLGELPLYLVEPSGEFRDELFQFRQLLPLVGHRLLLVD